MVRFSTMGRLAVYSRIVNPNPLAVRGPRDGLGNARARLGHPMPQGTKLLGNSGIEPLFNV